MYLKKYHFLRPVWSVFPPKSQIATLIFTKMCCIIHLSHSHAPLIHANRGVATRFFYIQYIHNINSTKKDFQPLSTRKTGLIIIKIPYTPIYSPFRILWYNSSPYAPASCSQISTRLTTIGSSTCAFASAICSLIKFLNSFNDTGIRICLLT